MAWSYEIRGEDDRLVEVRTGFAAEKAAQEAGERAMRMIQCICYQNLEPLSVHTEEEALPSHTDKRNLKSKYPWQQLVLDAFMESDSGSDSGKVLRKIAAAERALAARLGGATLPGSDEHFAVGEALLALGRLLSHLESKRPAGERNQSCAPEENGGDQEMA
jgi:hypothetical protein